jgi:isoleucyl-tRNA synthetase
LRGADSQNYNGHGRESGTEIPGRARLTRCDFDDREPSTLRNSTSELSFLAWTTTPWTLMANRALAVNRDLDYGIYNINGERLIVAAKRAEQIFGSAEPEEILKGKELEGLRYESLDGTTCQVFTADFVGSEEGTGIVHIAPAYGEDDYELYKKCNASMGDTTMETVATESTENSKLIGFVDVLDENGYYIPEYAEKLHALGVRDTDEHGIQIWAANKFIAKCLEEKGIVYKIEYIQHEYPFNPRSKERIMYRAFPSWFFDIAGQKPLMLAENENINWFPAYLKHGRFAKNIEQAPDWNLSRDRFWATAMPVWKSEEGTVLVIGSYEELKEFSGKELADYHRPWVDEIEFDAWVKDGQVLRGQAATAATASMGDTAGGTPAARRRQPSTVGEAAVAGPIDEQASPVGPAEGVAHLEHFTRIEKVLDCWFESGSMPFAQLHYPFENKEKFERNYPADFIVKYVGQVRAWFYYVHAVNTALAEIGAFGEKAKKGHKNAYKNVITTGTLAGNDGRKMSKSLGNFTDPNILMDQYSADALRFLLLSSPVLSGEDFALLDKDVSDVDRKLAMIWNVYDFFTTYAEIENVDSEEFFQSTLRKTISNPLDSWIISRMYQLRNEITAGMEEYNIPRALENVLLFIDDLSNWFVRRSRRRFSKNDDLDDKKQAFATLYYVLIYTAKLLAPFTPFLAEELYQKMTGSTDSVHLLEWPAAGEIDEEVLAKMTHTRQIITDALALRMQKSDTEQQIKIRQPLSRLTYDGEKLPDFYEQIIADEVNVKSVANGSELTLDKTLTEELKMEGYARDLIRAIQAARKHAGLQLDNQIKLSLSVDLPAGYEDLVKTEVNAVEVNREGNYAHDEIAKINGENITISLEKV